MNNSFLNLGKFLEENFNSPICLQKIKHIKREDLADPIWAQLKQAYKTEKNSLALLLIRMANAAYYQKRIVFGITRKLAEEITHNCKNKRSGRKNAGLSHKTYSEMRRFIREKDDLFRVLFAEENDAVIVELIAPEMRSALESQGISFEKQKQEALDYLARNKEKKEKSRRKQDKKPDPECGIKPKENRMLSDALPEENTNSSSFSIEKPETSNENVLSFSPLVPREVIESDKIVLENKDFDYVGSGLQDFINREYGLYSSGTTTAIFTGWLKPKLIDRINELRGSDTEFWENGFEELGKVIVVKSQHSFAEFKETLIHLLKQPNRPLIPMADFLVLLNDCLGKRFNGFDHKWGFDGQICRNMRKEILALCFQVEGKKPEDYQRRPPDRTLILPEHLSNATMGTPEELERELGLA